MEKETRTREERTPVEHLQAALQNIPANHPDARGISRAIEILAYADKRIR